MHYPDFQDLRSQVPKARYLGDCITLILRISRSQVPKARYLGDCITLLFRISRSQVPKARYLGDCITQKFRNSCLQVPPKARLFVCFQTTRYLGDCITMIFWTSVPRDLSPGNLFGVHAQVCSFCFFENLGPSPPHVFSILAARTQNQLGLHQPSQEAFGP